MADSIPIGPPDTERNIIEVNAHLDSICVKLVRLYSQRLSSLNENIVRNDTVIGRASSIFPPRHQDTHVARNNKVQFP